VIQLINRLREGKRLKSASHFNNMRGVEPKMDNQDHCQCPTGTHGHKPGECKSPITHPEDNMCDYCHDNAADDFIAMLPPGK
jgi:hypothetical protein